MFRERVYTEVEDIFLSDRQDKEVRKDSGRVSCRKRSERKQGREMVYFKVQVSTKSIKKWSF